MQATLRPHLDFGNLGLEDIQVDLERPSPSLLRLRYIMVGDISTILVPPAAEPLRTDRLWEGTCFELFLRRGGEAGYLEFNFSPSGEWAAYAFRGYREGMVQAAVPAPPEIRTTRSEGRLEVAIAVPVRLEDGAYAMNLTAVVRSRTGERTFWAVHHAGGEPDFHHPGCFREQLPAAGSS